MSFSHTVHGHGRIPILPTPSSKCWTRYLRDEPPDPHPLLSVAAATEPQVPIGADEVDADPLDNPAIVAYPCRPVVR